MVAEREIRTRSYLLWEADGRPQGRDVEFWLRAEAELVAEARCGAGSGASRTSRFVMPRLPISSPPRRLVATRIGPRERRTAAPPVPAIAASL